MTKTTGEPWRPAFREALPGMTAMFIDSAPEFIDPVIIFSARTGNYGIVERLELYGAYPDLVPMGKDAWPQSTALAIADGDSVTMIRVLDPRQSPDGWAKYV